MPILAPSGHATRQAAANIGVGADGVKALTAKVCFKEEIKKSAQKDADMGQYQVEVG
jgi:hypothetical protein